MSISQQKTCFVCDKTFTPSAVIGHTHPHDKAPDGKPIEICPHCIIDYANGEQAILHVTKRNGR